MKLFLMYVVLDHGTDVFICFSAELYLQREKEQVLQLSEKSSLKVSNHRFFLG